MLCTGTVWILKKNNTLQSSIPIFHSANTSKAVVVNFFDRGGLKCGNSMVRNCRLETCSGSHRIQTHYMRLLEITAITPL